jgi:seryl-tRNA synthetase
MHDLGFVRANLELVKEKLSARGADPEALLGNFAEVDARHRQAVTEVETLKAERNRLSEEVGKRKRSGEDASDLVVQTRFLKEEIERQEKEVEEAGLQMLTTLLGLPNLPHDSVPLGKSEKDNVLIRESDLKPRALNFHPKPHWELGESLGVLDFERGAKLSGARFTVYWDQGARLERALANFMLDIHTGEHGYTEVLPPLMVNSKSLFGTGQLPKFEADLFHCADPDQQARQQSEERERHFGDVDPDRQRRALFNDHWLIPTAEVPLTNLFRDEVLAEGELPRSLTAYTPCFRSEAGSYGRDVRGIIRQHQFQKVELVKFARPEDSYAELEKLTANAETILQKLELPYRTMLLCAGDMGFSAAKTYDIEVWLPGQGLYREISSCSNCEAFQARRANIRYRPQGKNKPEFVHTLNGSGLAVGRTWVAIFENYQQADGTVRIPDALVPYMGGATTIEPAARPKGPQAKGNGAK